MLEILTKMKKTIQAYLHHLNQAIIEIYLYYISPLPIFTLMKKLALANPLKKRNTNPCPQVFDLQSEQIG